MTETTAKKDSKLLPLSKLVPNIITIIGMCAGLSSIRFALDARWEMAVAAIMFAAFTDGLDGKLARMLKTDSEFGAQLDSLSDFVTFGVSPAIVMFLWQLQDIKKFGWAITLFFIVCCALRLARFNTSLSDDEEKRENFFTGVPAPSGALLALLPLVISFHFADFFTNNVLYTVIYMVFIGILMSSRIPTLSLKGIRISHGIVLPIMILAAAMIAFMVIAPWTFFVVCSALYYISIPVAVIMYVRKK